MTPRFSAREFRETKAWEYAVRFVFGGVVAVLAGWVTDRAGPNIGGLFLAFPALLPASLTLVKEHDGRRSARDDALGAAVGSAGLFAFAAVVYFGVGVLPFALTLALALLAWTLVASGLWKALLAR